MKYIFIISVILTCISSCTSPKKNKSEQNGNMQKAYNTNIQITKDNLESETTKKVSWFKKELEKSKTIGKLPHDFLTFNSKFVSDTSFQQQSIYFKTFIGVQQNCDSTYLLTQDNWNFTNYDFTLYFNKMNALTDSNAWTNNCYFNGNKVYIEFLLKDFGAVYRAGYEKINGSWYLTLLVRNNC